MPLLLLWALKTLGGNHRPASGPHCFIRCGSGGGTQCVGWISHKNFLPVKKLRSRHISSGPLVLNIQVWLLGWPVSLLLPPRNGASPQEWRLILAWAIRAAMAQGAFRLTPDGAQCPWSPLELCRKWPTHAFPVCIGNRHAPAMNLVLLGVQPRTGRQGPFPHSFVSISLFAKRAGPVIVPNVYDCCKD